MSKRNYIKEYLSNESLDKITDAIKQIESETSGEIRVCIKKKRGLFERSKTPRDIAFREFYKSGMHKTRDRSGVLLYIIFDEKKFEIIADVGINDKITSDLWEDISSNMKKHFSNSDYLEGIQYGLGRIGEVLISEFKRREDDNDELSNEVIIS